MSDPAPRLWLMYKALQLPRVREPLRPASVFPAPPAPAPGSQECAGLILAPTAARLHNLHIIWDQGSYNCTSAYLLSSGTSSQSCLIACNSPLMRYLHAAETQPWPAAGWGGGGESELRRKGPME